MLYQCHVLHLNSVGRNFRTDLKGFFFLPFVAMKTNEMLIPFVAFGSSVFLGIIVDKALWYLR